MNTKEQITHHRFFRTGAFIHGKWITAQTTYEDINPSTLEKIADVAYCTHLHAEAAVLSAETAFSSWKKTPAQERADFLMRWYDAVLENRDFLSRLMTLEQGKPVAEAGGEVDYAASFIRWFAEEARRANGLVIPPFKAGSEVFALKEPLGVVAAITPWNFPMAMITRKIAAALAAGCTAVVKPSPETPLCANALVAIADSVGLPPGVINCVGGDAESIASAFMESPSVRKITFTGSTATGKLLYAQSAGTVKRISLELGGNAPMIVFADCDLDKAVSACIANKFRNAGQVCVAINRILIEESVYDEFTRKLSDAVKTLKVADGFEDGAQIGPLITPKAAEKVLSHIEDAVSKGATLLTGGKRVREGYNFIEPAVLSGCTDDMLVSKEETFGPVASCFGFETETEAINRANNTPHGLAAYCFTNDMKRVFRIMRELEAGMVGINDTGVSSAVAPFGGVKESSLGREGSVYGLDEYLDVKTVHWGHSL